jgi:hypothetical protein
MSPSEICSPSISYSLSRVTREPGAEGEAGSLSAEGLRGIFGVLRPELLKQRFIFSSRVHFICLDVVRFALKANDFSHVRCGASDKRNLIFIPLIQNYQGISLKRLHFRTPNVQRHFRKALNDKNLRRQFLLNETTDSYY